MADSNKIQSILQATSFFGPLLTSEDMVSIAKAVFAELGVEVNPTVPELDDMGDTPAGLEIIGG